MFFLLQNRSGLLTKQRLYSTSVEVATINGEMDDTDDVANDLILPTVSITSDVLGYDDNVK